MSAKFAQHFLSNRHAAERIVEALGLKPTDNVLEIGPGKGALTPFLFKAEKVVAVEIDEEMAEFLRRKFGAQQNLQIVRADFLEIDLDSLGSGFKVVGNLPYNLTSPILRKLSEWNGWREALVMVQKEVADRLCAKVGTGEYGAVTVGVSLTCVAEPVFELAETSFDPPPKVKSAVVKLTRREKPLTENIAVAQRVIQAAFQQRRKTILNSLSHGLKMDKEKVQNVLRHVGVEDLTRPERIAVEDFVALAQELLSKKR